MWAGECENGARELFLPPGGYGNGVLQEELLGVYIFYVLEILVPKMPWRREWMEKVIGHWKGSMPKIGGGPQNFPLNIVKLKSSESLVTNKLNLEGYQYIQFWSLLYSQETKKQLFRSLDFRD